jgi:hypothetical protein
MARTIEMIKRVFGYGSIVVALFLVGLPDSNFIDNKGMPRNPNGVLLSLFDFKISSIVLVGGGIVYLIGVHYKKLRLEIIGTMLLAGINVMMSLAQLIFLLQSFRSANSSSSVIFIYTLGTAIVITLVGMIGGADDE